MFSRTGCALLMTIASVVLASSTMAADAAPKSIEIDLSGRAKVERMTLAPGDYRFTLLNALPNGSYTVSSETSPTLVISAPLPMPGTQPGSQITPPPPGGEVASPEKKACDRAVTDATSELNRAATEVRVGELVRSFEARFIAAGCDEVAASQSVKQIRKDTSVPVEMVFALIAGDELTMTVKRTSEPTLDFGPYVFATPELPGTWLALYGVNYIHSGDKPYFSAVNAGTTPTTYTITPLADRTDNEFSPSVYFMWIKGRNYKSWLARPVSWNSGDVFGGITAGIGFDFDNPTAFLGYGFGWGHNVMLTAGVAMQKETRLVGRYQPGDIVTENLTDKQLSEETYKPRGYVGIAFRFGASPFEKKAPAAAPAPAPAAP